MNEYHSNDPRYGSGYPPGYPSGYPADPRAYVRKKSKWIAGLLAFLIPGTGHLYLGQMAKGIAVMLLIALDICSIVFAATHMNHTMVIVLLSLLMPIIYFYNLFDAVQSTDIVNGRRYDSSWPPSYGMPASHAPGRMESAAGYAASMNVPPRDRAMPSDSSDSVPPPPGPLPGPVHGQAAGHAQHGTAPQGAPHGPGASPRTVNATGVMLLAAGVIFLLMVTNVGWTHGLFRSSGSMAGAVVLIGAGIGLWIWESRGQPGRKG